MVSQVERKPETRDEAILRMAGLARGRGIRVFDYVNPQGVIEWFATSSSEPDKLHRVTLLSCDCKGFCHHGYCSHFAALLDSFDQLPALPEPEPDPMSANILPMHVVAQDDQITAAEAEYTRLRRIAKTTTDFHLLNTARFRMNHLHAQRDGYGCPEHTAPDFRCAWCDHAGNGADYRVTRPEFAALAA